MCQNSSLPKRKLRLSVSSFWPMIGNCLFNLSIASCQFIVKSDALPLLVTAWKHRGSPDTDVLSPAVCTQFVWPPVLLALWRATALVAFSANLWFGVKGSVSPPFRTETRSEESFVHLLQKKWQAGGEGCPAGWISGWDVFVPPWRGKRREARKYQGGVMQLPGTTGKS